MMVDRTTIMGRHLVTRQGDLPNYAPLPSTTISSEASKDSAENYKPHVYPNTGIDEHIDDNSTEYDSHKNKSLTLFMLLLVLVLCVSIVNIEVVDFGVCFQNIINSCQCIINSCYCNHNYDGVG